MEGYISEIRLFAGNFAPQSYMLCQGQSLPIAQWNALYALIGTIYGGDGVQTFSLPDLRGRTAVGAGQAPGFYAIDEGQMGGAETTTLTTTSMPAHNHQVVVNSVNATVALKAFSTSGATDDPNGSYLSSMSDLYVAPASGDLNMATQSVSGTVSLPLGATGGGQPFASRSPYLGINFIICVEGIFPSRN